MLEEILSSAKQAAPYAAAASAAMIPIGSFLEWFVHKYMMHAPKGKRIKHFSEEQSRTHQDEHHAAYKAPKHYFQDNYNQDITSEFGWGEIAKLFFGSIGISAAIAAAYNFITPEHAMTFKQAAGLVTGTTAGVMGYYRAYETTHQWMHVLEKELFIVHKSLAHHIQEEPDGTFLVPLPFLDSLSNHVINEARAVQKNKNYVPVTRDDLVDALDHYLTINKQSGVTVTTRSAQHIITEMIDEHASYMKETPGARQSGFMNWVRNSRWFSWIHRHHYVHHQPTDVKLANLPTSQEHETQPAEQKRTYANTNLNVVFPIADYVLGTKKDSSAAALSSEDVRTTLWICPYLPPEGKTFSQKHPNAKRVKVKVTA